MCGNWNVRQAMSQQVFKVTTFCADTCFQFFRPWSTASSTMLCWNSADVATRRFCNLSVCIMGWYSIHAVLQHALDAVIYRVKVRTVGWAHVRTDELGCLTCRSLPVSWARCAGALSCRKTSLQQCYRSLAATLPSVRWKSFTFYKVVWWHFSGVVGKGVTLCFRLR